MIEEAAAEMAAIGWPGVEVHGYGGPHCRKDLEGIIYREPGKPIKEWRVTFFFILAPGFTTVKAIGKGKTLAEAINQAKGEAHGYNSRNREQVHLSPPEARSG